MSDERNAAPVVEPRSRGRGTGTAGKYNRKKEEAERLGIGTRTLERWVAGRVVPFRKIGRILLFDPVEVDRALSALWRVSAVGET